MSGTNNTHLSDRVAVQSATQSTTYAGLSASKAIDGDVNTISHTADTSKSHWLQLDLGQEYYITKVIVVNRWQAYCGRVNGMVAKLFNGGTETAVSAALVYKDPCGAVADQTYEFEFNGVTATTVKLVKDGASLNIAEVYVEGTSADSF